MNATTRRFAIAAGIVLLVALLALQTGHWQLLVGPAFADGNAGAQQLPQAYADMLGSWSFGYWFWRLAYIFLSAAAVSFPAVIAAGVPFQEHSRKVVAASAAAIIAITTFMQAGEKATAHEHAYVCMRLAAAAYSIGELKPHDLPATAKQCSSYIDYDYLDVSNTTGKGHENQDQTTKPAQ